MSKNPTISIAMATYNGARFLREQLDSLYGQTRLPDEVVVSDDGSTDGTLEILEEYHQRYGLRYEQNQGRKGVNGNFEYALRMATGDYVCLCDQDDIWLPAKTETLYTAMQSADVNLPTAVSSSRTDIDAEGKELGRPTIETTGRQWQDTLLHTGCSQGCTMMMNRRLVNQVLEIYAKNADANCYLYDVLISVTAALFGEKINLPDRLMLYRHHDKNVVDRLQAKGKGFWQRVHDMPTYYPFLLDYRIQELAQTDKLFEQEQLPSDRRTFLQQMSQLSQANNIWQGLSIVWRLQVIPTRLKLKVTLLTPIVRCLKRLQ